MPMRWNGASPRSTSACWNGAWTTISDAAKGAWDSMLNIGRPESLEAKLAAVEDAIDKAKQPNQIDNGEVSC